jgi:hypothetical protein
MMIVATPIWVYIRRTDPQTAGLIQARLKTPKTTRQHAKEADIGRENQIGPDGHAQDFAGH